MTEVMGVAKKFLREDAGYEKVTISSVVAMEPDSKWRVVAESSIGTDKKEIIIDDKDGNVVSYKPLGAGATSYY